MNRFTLLIILLGALAFAWDAPAQRQARTASIGYVYPAGARQGAASEHVIGGQFLAEGVRPPQTASPEEVLRAIDELPRDLDVDISGGGVTATLIEFIRPMGSELNAIRIKVDEMMARRAVVRREFDELQRFRSFRNAKGVKDAAGDDNEIAELKRKYAKATWTPADEDLLGALRRASGRPRRPANPAIANLAVFRITVAPDARPGQRELRIRTRSGVTNPLVFHIGDLPEVSEPASKNISEQRSTIAKTGFAPRNNAVREEINVSLPAVVNGQILPGEIDRYRFEARKGQRIVLATGARQLIPYISDAVPGWFQATLCVYDSRGAELAYADDFRFDPDPVLCCVIPADGEYVMEIKDAIYRGREDFVYRITVGEIPFITGIFPLGGPAGARTDVELSRWNLPGRTVAVKGSGPAPGIYPIRVRADRHISNPVSFALDTLPECLERESAGSVQPLATPVIVNGRIGRAGDDDAFAFQGRAGERIVAEVVARRLDSPLDSVLTLADVAGADLGLNDDNTDPGAGLTTHHADSYLAVTLPRDDTYVLRIRDTQHRGGPDYAYRLRVGPPMPDFALRIVPSSVNARPGAPTPVTVHALRKDGFDGPIAVSLSDAPDGFTLGGGEVPAGETQAKLTLIAPRRQGGEPVTLHVQGRATIDGREVVRVAVPAEDRMQAFEYRQLVPAQELRVAVSDRGEQRRKRRR